MFSITAPYQSRLEPGDWDWTAIGSIATAGAAVVTAVTIYFIFRQTTATRKSAEASERTAEAAFQALEHSQKQLDFSHRQHQQSMYMAAEAVKARIDAERPKLLVAKAALNPQRSIDAGERVPEALFEPSDSHRLLTHAVKFQVRNDGPPSAKLQHSERIKYNTTDASGLESIQQWADAEEPLMLAPGHTLHGEYSITKTLEYWMNEYKSRSNHEDYPEAHEFCIRNLTDADTGAHELHYIGLAGSALKPDGDQIGKWVHLSTAEMKSQLITYLKPTKRVYFLSRLKNETLPEIEWTSFDPPATY